jgi:hypothetical protein
MAALLAAFVCAPSVGWAETTGARSTDGDTIARRYAAPAPVDSSREATDYAAREAAAPALGGFEGGEAGIYIGGSAVGVLLILLIIVIIL